MLKTDPPRTKHHNKICVPEIDMFYVYNEKICKGSDWINCLITQLYSYLMVSFNHVPIVANK